MVGNVGWCSPWFCCISMDVLSFKVWIWHRPFIHRDHHNRDPSLLCCCLFTLNMYHTKHVFIHEICVFKDYRNSNSFGSLIQLSISGKTFYLPELVGLKLVFLFSWVFLLTDCQLRTQRNCHGSVFFLHSVAPALMTAAFSDLHLQLHQQRRTAHWETPNCTCHILYSVCKPDKLKPGKRLWMRQYGNLCSFITRKINMYFYS